jgi:hypothetical protein
MKTTALILFIVCCASKLSVVGQALFENEMRDKEAMEIAYITDCINMNRRVDSLIEWKLSGEDENFMVFKYRSSLAFFEIQKDTKDEYLQSITYYKNSFQKMIFVNEPPCEYEITGQTRFRVWMSKDKRSVYFCMINPDSLTMWVLTNGNTVYTSSSALFQADTNQDSFN